MQVGLNEVGELLSLRWRGLAEIGGLASASGWVWARMRWNGAKSWREQRLREELDAYAGLPQDGDMRQLSELVCKVVAEKSAFYRVAMLVRDAGWRLSVAESVGMDDLTVRALNVWGGGVVEAGSGFGMRVGNRSFAVVLRSGPEDLGCGRAIVVPLRTSGGRMVGALAVCADGMMSVSRRVVDEALLPMEMLAVKLERAMENGALADFSQSPGRALASCCSSTSGRLLGVEKPDMSAEAMAYGVSD
jgi:hypothetical protein